MCRSLQSCWCQMLLVSDVLLEEAAESLVTNACLAAERIRPLYHRPEHQGNIVMEKNHLYVLSAGEVIVGRGELGGSKKNKEKIKKAAVNRKTSGFPL